jgi:hypothetical protein
MRKTITALVAATLLAATGGVLYSSDAFGATMSCTGPFSGTFLGNVTVPSGSVCNLQGALVGNVAVLPGGALIVGGGTTINGNLSASNAGTASGNPFGTGTEAFSVIVCNSKVTGKTAISGSASQVLLGGTSSTGGGCGGNSFGSNVSPQSNKGRVTLSENGGSCAAPGGTCGIGGNALVTSNTPGPVTVTNNVITGNLSCFSNANVTSSGNTATTKNGQCPA